MAITTVSAPMPGTFYHRPAPDQPAFKQDGDAVAVGETVGLIEVMKTFNAVTAETAGKLVRYLVDNEEPVMAGDPLYEIET